MSLLQAILMGIIQGATEFLPVSSSGHLAIFKNIFGVETDTGILFDILLHFGTLGAIFIVYWADIKKGCYRGTQDSWRLLCQSGKFHKEQDLEGGTDISV